MADLKDALDAIKTLAKQFAPLATVGESVDALAALVAHEDELKGSIQSLLGRKAALEAECQQRVADAEAEIADKQRRQREAEEGYQARLDALDQELKTAKAGRQSALDGLEADVTRERRKAQTTIAALAEAVAAEKSRIETEHAAFIEETKTHRARIEANTASLQASLDALRSQAKGALAAVEPTPQA